MIQVKNLSKRYSINPLNRTHQKSFKEELTGLFIPKKTEKFWALKNVNCNIEKGGNVGVIGNNGSGKSTLLKLLARITPPTQGEIRLKGKVSAVLDIGVGFSSELTGRENIFLRGTMLGYKSKDISDHLDEIIDFSEIGKFIDTPVKHYSSGMFVRLAFAIITARFMKPEILLLDEVLAVGDAGFYKKCLERISELVKESSTTVLLVSHNLKQIEKLCESCIWVDKGELKMIGETKKVIQEYLAAK